MNMLFPEPRTYGNLAFDGDQQSWHVTELPPHVSLRFKSLFSRVAKTSARNFILADSPTICGDLVWFMNRFPLRMAVADRRRLESGREEELRRQEQVDRILVEGWSSSAVQAFQPETPPYPFQAQAAELASKLGRLLLMDDVGLGKTVSALAAICRSGQMPAAVVVQPHLGEQWAEYVDNFTTLRAHVIRGTKPYELPSADIYIFKYSNIAGWVDIATTGLFKAVIFDEMQELRHGRSTQKGKAASVFVGSSSIRMGLTATPIYNYGSEIFNVVQFLEPGALGSWDEFIIEWCTSSGQNWIVREPDALGSYLREIALALRRTESDVGDQMPPVNTLLHHIDYDEDAVRGVEAEARTLALKVLNGSFTERGVAARELDMMARHATGMAKATGVAQLVRMLIESGERVLLAGWHRDVYTRWLDLLSDLKPVMYTGTESSKQKNRAKQAFVEGDSDVMLISLRSGSGLDGLQHVCRTVVVGELDWSPQVHRQLIGRLRRPGQKHQVDAIYAHTNGGSDPVIVEMLGLKSAQSQGIVDPFSGAQTTRYSDDTRIRTLAKAYLEKEAAE